MYCLNVNTFAKGSAQNGLAYLRFEPCIKLTHIFTVLPAKSDSCVMFCLQSYQGVIIDISLVYKSFPQDKINTQVIYRFELAQVGCTSKCFT